MDGIVDSSSDRSETESYERNPSRHWKWNTLLSLAQPELWPDLEDNRDCILLQNCFACIGFDVSWRPNCAKNTKMCLAGGLILADSQLTPIFEIFLVDLFLRSANIRPSFILQKQSICQGSKLFRIWLWRHFFSRCSLVLTILPWISRRIFFRFTS
jgi:hypothetical protein